MRVVRVALLILVGLASIAGLAAWTCPADLGYRLAGGALAPLGLRDISGSIWKGHAAHADVLGTDLGAIDWTLQPLPLLHGTLAAHVTLSGPAINASGDVERNGTVMDFRDALLRIPASIAAPALAIPALDLLGTIEIDVVHARLHGLLPEQAAGSALWRNAAVGGAAQASLGDLKAAFASAPDGAIAGTAQDLGGPLELAATFRASLGRYEAQARLSARGDNPQLDEALQYIGQPQADGSRNLEIRGSAFGLFGSNGR